MKNDRVSKRVEAIKNSTLYITYCSFQKSRSELDTFREKGVWGQQEKGHDSDY